MNCSVIRDNIVKLDNVWNSCDIDIIIIEGLFVNVILMLENVEYMCNEIVIALFLKNVKIMVDMLDEIN